MPHGIDEMPFEPRAALVDVGQVALRIQLREDAMAAIQVHQAVAMAALLSAELRVLARGFRGQQQVASFDGDLLRALEVLLGRG